MINDVLKHVIAKKVSEDLSETILSNAISIQNEIAGSVYANIEGLEELRWLIKQREEQLKDGDV